MNLLTKIFESLKFSNYGDWRGVVFGVQFLAWDKLSREDQIPDGLKINQFENNLEVISFIKYVFGELNNENVLGANASAFEYDDWNLRAARSTDLHHLLNLVAFPPKTETFSFDELINECIRFVGGREGYLFSLPPELTDLMIDLCELQKGDQVYCPFDGSLGLAVKANYITPNVGAEVKIHSPFPYLLNILFDRSVIIKEGNPVVGQPNFVEGEKLQQFDAVLANPPFGVRYQDNDLIFFMDMFDRFPEQVLLGDVLQIRHILAQTKKRAVVIVSDGLLFRTTAGEKEFKKDLVVSGMLKAVIGLPSGLLTYSGVSLSVIVLDKEDKSDSILFINAVSERFYEKRMGTEGSGFGKHKLINTDVILELFKNGNGDFIRLVPKAECAENDYNLLAQRYVSHGARSIQLDEIINEAEVKLEELVEFLRPQTLKDYITTEGEECYEVAISDIKDNGLVQQPKKSFLLSPQSLRKLKQQILQPEDILLSIKGAPGYVGFVPPELPDEKWFANQSLLILRMRYNKHFESPIVLFRYLASPTGQALLKRLVGRISVPMLQTKDVKALPVVIPSKREQTAVIKDHQQILSIYEEISQLQAKAEEIEKRHWTIN